ncbi:hypothetical protein EV121DRAFT_295013 [Schizophyllum commune]
MVRVYPKKPATVSEEYYLYRHLASSFDAELEAHHLLFRYQLPHSISIFDLLERVWGDMGASPFSYNAPQPAEGARNHLRPHEMLPLILCRFINRGVPRTLDQQIRIEPAPLRAQMTLGDLMRDRRQYVPNPAFLTHAFVPIFFVTRDPLVAMTASFEDGEPERVHTCIPAKLWRLFPQDELNVEINEELPVSSDEGDDDREDALAVSRILTSASTNALQHRARSVSSQAPPGHAGAVGVPVVWALPANIWGFDWVPSDNPVDAQFCVEDYGPRKVAQAAFRGRTMTTVAFQAQDVSGLGDQLWEACLRAYKTDNFDDLLTMNRSWRIVDDDGNTVSFGEGLGREAITHVLLKIVGKQHGRFFRDRLDGYSTIACSQPYLSSGNVASARKDEIGQLGAFFGHCIAQGFAPLPIGPLVLLLALSAYNLKELTVDRVAFYHPAFQRTLMTFIELGPTGDISSSPDLVALLASFFDQQAASLAIRDQQSHNAAASMLLFNCIMGPEPPTHPEIVAWTRGLKMACPNGFTLAQVMQSFSGGPLAFLEGLYHTGINSFEDLEPHMRWGSAPRRLISGLLARYPDDSPSELFCAFLQRTGVPCPALFDDIKDALHETIPVDEESMNDPGYRSRMFLRAATGAERLQLGPSGIMVDFVSSDNICYADTEEKRESMARQGIISFSTCSRTALVPAAFFSTIAEMEFQVGNEPSTFENAIDHWLLMAILTSIATHTKA